MAAVESPPYQAYAAIVGTFVGGLGAAGLLARVLGRNPACQTGLDLVVLSAASFKAARTLAHDEVTSFVRDPFVKGDAHEGDEDPLPTGDYRQAIGELVTCSRCGGTWAAAALVSTQILAPRFGRLLTWSLAAAGVNDWLQAGFAALSEKANDLESRASD
jgi:enoyl-CoA hydratase/carnithine racemase